MIGFCDAGAGGYERGPYPDRGGYGAERGYPGEYDRGGYDRGYPPSAVYGCAAGPYAAMHASSRLGPQALSFCCSQCCSLPADSCTAAIMSTPDTLL